MDLGSSWGNRHGVYKKADLRKDIKHQLAMHTGLGKKRLQFHWGLTCQNCDESTSIVSSRNKQKQVMQTDMFDHSLLIRLQFEVRFKQLFNLVNNYGPL